MNEISLHTSAHHRALVLGGGGSAGNAWLIGIIAGLYSEGVDVTRADLIVGTSAGATAAAQITGRSPGDLVNDILHAPMPSPSQQRPDAPLAKATPSPEHLTRLRHIIAASADAADMRLRVSASGLELDGGGDPARQAQWRAIVARRLPSTEWPTTNLALTAIDAFTGEPVVFDRNSGVDLADAVAASTSGVLPHGIGERQYLDGGYRRNENADLATGHELVLVFSPLGGRTLHPLEWRMQLAAQVEELEASGSTVEVVVPDAAGLEAMGDNLMDYSTRPAVARAGFQQGSAIAEHLSRLW